MKLRLWCKLVMASLVFMAFILLCVNVHKETEQAIDNCVNKGYSHNYCVAKLG